MQPYVLALSDNADGGGELQPLEDFTTNAAGAAIVNTVGPILEIVQGGADAPAATWSSHRDRRQTRATPSRCRFPSFGLRFSSRIASDDRRSTKAEDVPAVAPPPRSYFFTSRARARGKSQQIRQFCAGGDFR
jgi:hypothetical protein